MAGSMSIIAAEVSFLDSSLSVIHIPTSLYSFFIQPILRLLFGDDLNADGVKIPWTNRHSFFNLTITPIEVSIICSRALGEHLFRPLVSQLRKMISATECCASVEISHDEYTALQVDGEGLDAGQRVLELTSPLAIAGIPLFFISTYFSDFVVVPSRARHTVSKVLEERGFAFSKTAHAFVSQLSSQSPTWQQKMGWPTSSSVSTVTKPPTPPAKDVSELETRTFTKLKKNGIDPTVQRKLHLVNCAGQRDLDPAMEAVLQNDLTQVLLSTTSETLAQEANGHTEKLEEGTTPSSIFSKQGQDVEGISVQDLRLPVNSQIDLSTRFLSVTITSDEPISILMEHSLRDRLGSSLLGAKDIEDVLIPITLDLRDLPIDATGIVCGVAGSLARCRNSEKAGRNGGNIANGVGLDHGRRSEEDSIDIMFLSTAKAGTVLVKACELDSAMEALESGMKGVAQALT